MPFLRWTIRNQYPMPPGKLVIMVCFISCTSMAPTASSQHLPFRNTLKGIVWIFWLIVGLVHATRGRLGGAPWCCKKLILFSPIGPPGNLYNPRILDTTLTTQTHTRNHQYHCPGPLPLIKCPGFRPQQLSLFLPWPHWQRKRLQPGSRQIPHTTTSLWLHLMSTRGCSKWTHFLLYHKGPTLARGDTTWDQRWCKTHTSRDPPIVYYAIFGKQEEGQGQEIGGAAVRRALRLVSQGRIILLGGGWRLHGLR